MRYPEFGKSITKQFWRKRLKLIVGNFLTLFLDKGHICRRHNLQLFNYIYNKNRENKSWQHSSLTESFVSVFPCLASYEKRLCKDCWTQLTFKATFLCPFLPSVNTSRQIRGRQNSKGSWLSIHADNSLRTEVSLHAIVLLLIKNLTQACYVPKCDFNFFTVSHLRSTAPDQLSCDCLLMSLSWVR